jgi:hypothetical protein
LLAAADNQRYGSAAGRERARKDTMTKMLAIIAAVFALGAAPAVAATSTAPGPYKLDAKNKCHAANGQFAKQSLCAAASASAAKPAPARCKDAKGKFVKCGAAGAKPA